MSIGAWFKNSITELRSRNLRGAPKTDVVHASGAREGGRSIVPTVDHEVDHRAQLAKGQMCTWYCSRECRPPL